ncbi:MAG: response regulator [Deltaproteobacteria bacterium]|nr:MAG: response regulator [Deltaproteobacteria bacterium]
MDDISVLLVDDEDEFRQTIAKRLAKRGFTLEQARNGEACLSMLENKSIDVVVLDVRMPGMNGIEVLNHIKGRYPKTEVILLTGHATTEDGVEGIKSGAFDYLMKPIKLEHLLGKIRQAWEKIQREKERIKEAEFRSKMEQQMIACERLASLGTLAAGVAHEINNPLAIIKESAGWMKLLLEKTEQEQMPRKQDLCKALNKIENSIERARRITHQLLGFARKTDSVLCETNIKELVEETVELVKREATYKEIEISQQMDSSLKTFWTDPYQLRQVLMNLLTNAVHATGVRGKITVIVENQGDQVVLTVKDTGRGIPKENMERIFEPFFSTKAPGEGTGLGLFVSRGMVERLGGTIIVESQLGKGASFCVRLPKHPRAEIGLEKDGPVDWIEKIKEFHKNAQ